MSLIEEALKKIQGARTAERPAPTPTAALRTRAVAAPSAIPVARKKRTLVEGPKHHVSEADLIAGGLLAPHDKAMAIADEFRRIKRPLIANATGNLGPDRHRNVIMIASGLPAAGKTFCSVNLAVSISLERELNVLLVDADVAKPHISRAFGLAEAPGLIDLLLDETKDLDDLLVRTDLNDIQVLPAGRSHPQATELLASDRMSKVVEELATRYSDRIIILDSPPLLITSEAHALSSHAGQIALVVEAGRTSHQDLTHTVDVLRVLDTGKPVNVILNKARPFGRRFADYGADYGYYGAPPAGAESAQ